MNIDTVSGNKLQAALLAAFKLDGDVGVPAGAEAAAAAVTSVLCAFAEVIAAVAFPEIPMIEGFAVAADETPALILAELRGLRADLAGRAFCDASFVKSGGLTRGQTVQVADALCSMVARGTAGLSIAEGGEQLTAALLTLNGRTVPA